jgi:hypothetical protein
MDSLGCGLIGALGVGCASPFRCPPDTLLNPGQQRRLEFIVRNHGFVSDWYVYSIDGDSLMFCEDDIITEWQSEIENMVFLDPGSHSKIRVWTRVDTLASPGDTLAIDFDVVASNNPELVDSCDVNVFVGNTVTAVGIESAPSGVSLNQNVPNPFNPTTRIDFAVDTNGPVSLRIFDISGRLVRTLVSGGRAGCWYAEEWDGRDDLGNQVSSGVYFYQLTAGDKTLTRKAVLIR